VDECKPLPSGHFFLGDVRNARLLRHFHASVQCYTAEPDANFTAFRLTAASAAKREKEFLAGVFGSSAQALERPGTTLNRPNLVYDSE